MDQKDVLRNKQYRGQIMRVVAMFYPSPTVIKQVKLALQEYGMNYLAEIDKHLFYLEDKGYIRRAEGFIRNFADDDKIYITAKGIDLIEGTIDDDGLLL